MGALRINNNKEMIVLEQIKFLQNKAEYYGAGIYADNFTHLAVSNSLFSDGVAARVQANVTNNNAGGGGVWAVGGGVLNIDECQFHENSGDNGGGVFASDVDRITIRLSTFTANKAHRGAAVAFKFVNQVYITNIAFAENIARGPGAGAAIYLFHVNGAEILNLEASLNKARGAHSVGGVLVSIGSSLNLTNAVMEDNYAYTAHGAAVVIRSVPKSGEIVMNNVTIRHDPAPQYGVYCDASPVSFKNIQSDFYCSKRCTDASGKCACEVCADEHKIYSNLTEYEALTHFSIDKSKKIITLVGYDDIPYSNFTRLEEKVEKILSRFNASTHYVAINPASVYIGKLFRLAVKLGFSTIGVANYPHDDVTYSDYCEIVLQLRPDQPSSKGLLGLTAVERVFVGLSDFVFGFGGGFEQSKILINAQQEKRIEARFFDFKPDAKAIPAAILRNCGVEGQFYDQCGVCDGTGSTCAQNFLRFSNGAMLSMLPQGPSNSTANVTDHLIVIALEALMDDNNKLDGNALKAIEKLCGSSDSCAVAIIANKLKAEYVPVHNMTENQRKRANTQTNVPTSTSAAQTTSLTTAVASTASLSLTTESSSSSTIASTTETPVTTSVTSSATTKPVLTTVTMTTNAPSTTSITETTSASITTDSQSSTMPMSHSQAPVHSTTSSSQPTTMPPTSTSETTTTTTTTASSSSPPSTSMTHGPYPGWVKLPAGQYNEKYVRELQQMLSSINQHFNQTNIDLSAFIAFDPKIALPSTSIIHEATTVYMNLGHSTSAQTVLVGPTDDASSHHCLYHDLARHDMRYTTVAAVLGMSLPNDDHLCERTTAQEMTTAPMIDAPSGQTSPQTNADWQYAVGALAGFTVGAIALVVVYVVLQRRRRNETRYSLLIQDDDLDF